MFRAFDYLYSSHRGTNPSIGPHRFGVTAPTGGGCPAAGGQTHLTGYGKVCYSRVKGREGPGMCLGQTGRGPPLQRVRFPSLK